MLATYCLSSCGSDRATAYQSSAKIIRHSTDLYVTWLDAPTGQGEPTNIMLAVCNTRAPEPRRVIRLASGYDNHCGAALALDPNGRLHALIGAHGRAYAGGGAFSHRWSDAPADLESWSAPTLLGPADTYPSLVVDAKGTLHLVHRECGLSAGDRWQLWYRRKVVDGNWEDPRPLVVSRYAGYSNFGHSMAMGPTGAIHLLFQFHDGETGHAADCRTVGIAHLRSADGGDTWLCDDAPLGRYPAEIDSLSLIRYRPEGGLGISNLVVDAHDRPLFVAKDPDAPTGLFWRHTFEGWQCTPIPRLLPGRGFLFGGGSLTLDAQGRTHLVAAAPPDGHATGFYDPAHELCHLVFDAQGDLLAAHQITDGDPTVARWLPALEPWDWVRQDECCADGPWLLYTEGRNQGGIGGDNRNTLRTRVWLGKLGAATGRPPHAQRTGLAEPLDEQGARSHETLA